MLKPTFFILSSIILCFAGTSQAGLKDVFNKIIPGKCDLSVGVFHNVPEVKKFIKTFFDAVDKSDILKNLFDFSNSTSQEYADYVKDDIKQTLKKIGVDEKTATTVGDFGAEAIPKIKKLTRPIVTRAIANIPADFLYIDGDLTPENAEDRAKALAKSMEDSAKATVTSDPKSKFVAVNNGFVFAKDKELSLERVPIVGFYVGNEWFIAASNPC